MREFEILLLLLAIVVALVPLARRLSIPYPILLVIGGVLLGLLPGAPRVSPDPALVFVVFVPPLVFASGFLTSFRDFRANRGMITLHAVGLVLATTAIVAVVSHWLIPGMTWAAGFVLGAVVSATDSVTAGAIAERSGLPQRLITLLAGESMINDAISLVIYRVAVAAVVTGGFALERAGGLFVLASVGGALIGLGIGWAALWLLGRIADAPTATTVSLLVPYAVYLPAAWIGLSGVLAVIAAALYVGYRYPQITRSSTRLEGISVWETMVFVFNGLIFLLLGLHLRDVLDALHDRPSAGLVMHAVVVLLTVVLVRIAWMFLATYLRHLVFRRRRAESEYPSWRYPAVLSWAGMRGADTIVVALSLPLTTATGAPFPDRGQIIFIMFTVIVVTLLVQGLTLPVLIRHLHIQVDGSSPDQEVAQARLTAARAAVRRLNELDTTGAPPQSLLRDLRRGYEARERQYHARYDGVADQDAEAAAESARRLRWEVLDAERHAVIGLRDDAAIGDVAFREVQRELDLEESELGRR